MRAVHYRYAAIDNGLRKADARQQYGAVAATGSYPGVVRSGHQRLRRPRHHSVECGHSLSSLANTPFASSLQRRVTAVRPGLADRRHDYPGVRMLGSCTARDD